MRRWLRFVVLLALMACDSPLGVVLNEGKTFTVLSGDDGTPVSGTLVLVGGDSLFTDSQGRFVLSSEARSSSTVVMEAEGFMTRETTLGSGGVHTLWPMRITPQYIKEFVYDNGLQNLRRPTADRISVVLSDEIANDPRTTGSYAQAISEMNAITSKPADLFSLLGADAVTFVLATEATATGLIVRLSVDPSKLPENAVAAAATTVNGDDIIVGARIMFLNKDYAQSPGVVMHELGHVLGLKHSSYGGLMSPNVGALTSSDILTFRMMRQRLPGTHFPDNDISAQLRLSAAAAYEVETLIICDFR